MNIIKTHVTSERFDIQSDQDRRTLLQGVLFSEGNVVAASTLASSYANATATEDFQRSLQDANGFYAAIHQNARLVFATVDRLRSIPLFYALQNGDFYLSDDAEWLRKEIGASEFDVVARDEFQRAGFVTGSDTLLPQMKQLQAGECLLATVSELGVRVELHRYYRFTHVEPTTVDEESLKTEFMASAEASIKRLVQHAAGRQIVIPLSGGYDSRFIATLLKQHRYPNLLTFTYGVPGNKESEYSKRVADSLDLKWVFVEYSDEQWSAAWKAEDRWQYQLRAAAWSSIPHMQDWLAVRILREKKLIEPDCIFVPGHSGDFVAGSHIPENAFSNLCATNADLLYAIKEKHHRLAPVSRDTPDDKSVDKRILDRVEIDAIGDVHSNVEYANAFEKWDWQERQAKFIANSVRVYEFYGYSWWLPLWDLQFMRFWQVMPLALRRERQWYVRQVDAAYGGEAQDNLDAPIGNADGQGIRSRIMRSPYSRGRLAKLIIRLARALFRKSTGPTHLSWRARYPGGQIDELIASGYSAVGVNAYDVLITMGRELDRSRKGEQV